MRRSLHFLHPRVRPECTIAFGDRLSAIMSTGYEAELHSPAGRARRRRGVPERRAAPQLPPGGRGARRDAVGNQPGGARARGARRRGAVHPHDAQRRPDRGRRALPRARQACLRGTGRRQRSRARSRAAAGRAAAPHGAARGGADSAGAADRVLLPGLSRGRAGDRRQRASWSTSRPRGSTPACGWASSSTPTWSRCG